MNNKNVISHYASPYYDPVKAHEYYMKHRNLKGRRPTSKLSDQGKQVWAVAKDSIATEKKETLKQESDNNSKRIEEYRQMAAATRNRITERLKQVNEMLNNSKGDKTQIKNEKARYSESAKVERQQLSENLKAIIQATRESYKQSKQKINDKYENIFQQEYDRIRKAMPYIKKAKTTKSK